MPELPDIVNYIEALQARILGKELKRVQISAPFLLRTAVPPVTALIGRQVVQLRRIGKRIAFGFDDELWLVVHLMIAGRLNWTTTHERKSKLKALALLEFPNGVLSLTEAGTKRRASLHILRGENMLQALDPGGLDVFDSSPDAFAQALTRQNHTLKRALTDPHIFSGIGNAYSDEILHRARLSPVTLTKNLSADDIAALRRSTIEVLTHWTELLREQRGTGFPEQVTAFRPEMAVHGKFGKPCPACGTKVQRIRYADNETNYCPACQTKGRLLADRSLSLLLKRDWPKTPEELEELRRKPT